MSRFEITHPELESDGSIGRISASERTFPSVVAPADENGVGRTRNNLSASYLDFRENTTRTARRPGHFSVPGRPQM